MIRITGSATATAASAKTVVRDLLVDGFNVLAVLSHGGGCLQSLRMGNLDRLPHAVQLPLILADGFRVEVITAWASLHSRL